MKATGFDHHCHRDRDGIVFTLERRALHMRRRGIKAHPAPAARTEQSFVAPLQLDLPRVVPRVLLISADPDVASVVQLLLAPEVFVNHVTTMANAREAACGANYTLAVIDPQLADGDAMELLPALRAAQLLIYADNEPEWSLPRRQYLCKSQTSARQLWSILNDMLRIGGGLVAGD